MMRILVTGGAGFIGSAVCRRLVGQSGDFVVNLDRLTYASNLDSLKSIERNENYRFVHADIRDEKVILDTLRQHEIEGVMHLAAESHVDRSIDGPADFVDTNIVGTFRLLNAALEYWMELDRERKARFRFHHISTDEVFGDLPFDSGVFTEETAYDPSSPYSASKASSDHLAWAWHRTYGLPVVMSNCSNNYGCFQFPEKLIPLMILNGVDGKPLPVYGEGANIRDWLHVEDHAAALEAVIKQGKVGESYNVGGRSERSNLQVVREICRILNDKRPAPGGKRHEALITFVEDRPGHDRRYAIDPSKIENELGWSAERDFEAGLEETVIWYLENEWWWTPIRKRRYSGDRLGLGSAKAGADDSVD